MFTFNVKKADPNQNTQKTKLPAIKQDNSRSNMNKYFEKLASNEIQRLNTLPSNNNPTVTSTKSESIKTEPTLIELHNLKHIINNNNTSHISNGVKEVIINDKDDVYDAVQI